jgi:phage terminase large subunit
MSVLTTTVFEQNLLAYTSGSTLIVNQGGTRSSKSYSIMQLLLEIAIRSKKPLIISVCSYALPHLKLGVMRDFDEILLARGFIPDAIKNKTDNFYKIGKTTIEFFGTDNLGKVHGPARDILFINEGNFIKPEVYTQLAIRTKQAIFIDFNPTREFWYHSEIQGKVAHELIKSTYKHNQFLTLAQIERIEAKKTNVEWWRVYGEGELGRLEDAIFTNWEYGEFDKTLPYIYALDFGSRDPDAMIKIAVDSKLMRIYVDEMLYQSGNSTADLYKLITDCGVKKELIVADSAGTRTITDLDALGLNIEACVKNKILDDIKAIKDYQIIVTENSYNVVRELNTWVWLNKKGEVPLDDNNHTIDPVRYGFNRLTKKQFIRKMRVL